MLTILLASIYLCSFTSAFAVRSIQDCHGKQLDLRLLSLGGHRHKFHDGFHCFCDGALLWCNVMAFIAPIVLFPLPSVASIQQSYPVSDVHAWSEATPGLTTSPSGSITELGLKPATDTKPQIMLKSRIQDDQSTQRDMTRKDNRDPILQGLIYFPEFAPKDPSSKVSTEKQETRELDYFNDVLVLTAVSSSQPSGPVLAGAKLPVASIRFPFSFQMYEENLLLSRPGVQAAWESVVNNEDILLRASICPRDSSSFPCNDEERKKYAEGVATLITKLPGLNDGDYIRAPASLPLQ